MAAPGELRFIFRVTFSTIGILVGTSVLIVFGFKFRNWNAAIWGMMSGYCHVLLLFYLHIILGRGVTVLYNSNECSVF